MITQQNLDSIHKTFNFTVDKYRLSGPENMRTSHFGLFRSDTLDCVGVAVKQQYQPHTVEDIVTLVDSASSAFEGEATVECYWKDGHHITVAPSKEHRIQIYGREDNIFPRLVIKAGYNGTAFSSCLGFYRDACKNLAMLRSVSDTCVKIRHTHSLHAHLEDLNATFQGLAAKWDGTVDSIQRMESTRTDLRQFIESVYPADSVAPRGSQSRANNRTDAIISRLRREQRETGRATTMLDNVSVWEAFNAVQGYVQHDSSRRGNPTSFDRAIMAFDSPAVIKAESLAMQLAS